MQVFLIWILLFIIPIIILPFGTSYFEIPKVIATELGIQLVTLFFVWKTKIRVSLPDCWPFIALFVLSVGNMILFKTPTGLFGNAFRLQGAFMLWNLMLFSFVVSQMNNTTIPTKYPIFTLLCLTASIFLFGQNESGRSFGLLGEPNALAATAVYCVPFIIIHPFGTRKLWLKILSIICVLLILMATRSRSALIGFGLELCILYLYTYSSWSLKTIGIATTLLMLSSLALPLFENHFVYENRSVTWITSIYAGIRYPITGWGFGNSENAIQWASKELSNNLRYVYVDSAHNILIDWWVQGGIIGFFLMLYIIIRSCINMVRSKKILELTLFYGVMTTLLFNPASITVLLAFWWTIGRSYTTKVKIQNT